MRVTEMTNYETVRNSIARSKGRMEKLQQQSATLKKLNTPSDDPVGAAKILEIRTDKVNNDQYQMNAKLAQAFLENTDHVLGELSDLMVRAKEIAIGQSSGASANQATRLGVAEEVTQLYNQAVATANRRIGDRYLFGGYKTDRPPISEDGKFIGDEGQIMTEVGKDIFISINISGHEAFNTNPKRANIGPEIPEIYNASGRFPAEEDSSRGAGLENANVFDELQNLRISLLANDQEGIRSTLDRFDQIFTQLNTMRAKVGSRAQGVMGTTQALDRHNVTNAELSSALEDADMAQVASDLTKEETVFRNVLASAHKLVQPTLMDFLK
ncbi:MAG: flagellar hook-associated protein FlgL [Deltaproteobacteria bacterium]|nr:flagellar hook-associated protein FlgL [Deltaproteobacteria bacterium]